MIGTTISHYTILEKLGEGGMGVVYKARDTALDRFVTMKFLPKDLTRDPEAKARFIQEAKATSALQHTNICTIHEVGETESGDQFIVMEYLEGVTLKQKISPEGDRHAEPLSVNESVVIALQIAQGLSKAHEQGIIHRDIKPANIIITKDNVAKIIDFGLAKLTGQVKLTKIGSTVGTVAYMSPEQIQGMEVDHRSDLFSFGVMLYEMVTGHLPFRGDHEAALNYSIVHEEPIPVRTSNAPVPASLEKILSRCLEKDRDKRYQHAADIIRDLKQSQLGAAAYLAPRKEASPRLWLVGTVVIFLIVAACYYFFLMPKPHAEEKKSIAVIPFRNITGSAEYDYFSEGLAEDIRTQLSKISNLLVISQQAVLRFKNSTVSIKDIARTLHVDAVLEGSVQREGDRAHVNTQLIDGETEGHLWGETYDEEGPRLTTLQSRIALKVVAALKTKLTPEEKELIEKKRTDNITAYDYYSKGREYYNRHNKSDNESAILLFRKALTLDPSYALAYAGLGDAYAFRPGFGYPGSMLDTAIALSNKAISIDTNLAEGYKALGLAYQHSVKHDKAIEAYRHAIDLNPNYCGAMINMANSLMWLGRIAEAMTWYKRAVRLDNMNSAVYSGLAELSLLLGRDTTARQYSVRASELRPEYHLHGDLSNLYIAEGDYDKAMQEIGLAFRLDSTDGAAASNAAFIYAVRGDYEKARKYCGDDSVMLGYLYKKGGKRKLSDDILNAKEKTLEYVYNNVTRFQSVPLLLAFTCAIKGNKEKAYAWLQTAIDGGWRDYRISQVIPFFEDLRKDTRFHQMMADIKAKVDEQRQLVELMEKSEGAGN